MKLEEFAAARDEVMVFHERAAEAARLAARLMKEENSKRRGGGGGKRGRNDEAADAVLGAMTGAPNRSHQKVSHF